MLEFIQHLPVVFTLVVFAERMREVFTKRTTLPGQTTETLTFNLFMLCGVLMVASGIAEYYLRHLTLWWPTFLSGAVLSIASFVLRRSAIRALGKFWSVHVEMRETHEFIHSGPFEHARHPVYFSMILELTGLALVLNAWITFAGVMLVFIPTMIVRVRIEESALLVQFGDVYRAYMRDTPAIFPRLRARKGSSS